MKHFLRWISVLLSLVISSAQAADIQGLWNYENGVGNWIIGVSNGVIYGSSYWFQNGGWSDKLEGTVSGNTVSITRYLSRSGNVTQTFTGTVSGTTVSGTASGAFINPGDNTKWTATITPLTTSSTGNCPTTPTCPVCPVTPACPVTPPTGDCTATYNADTGKFTAPCVAVPVVEPFVGKKILNYSIEMQQRTGAYTFDLDLNTVKQRQ